MGLAVNSEKLLSQQLAATIYLSATGGFRETLPLNKLKLMWEVLPGLVPTVLFNSSKLCIRDLNNAGGDPKIHIN